MKVLIIVFNSFENDNRVERQARELVALGANVFVLALDGGRGKYFELRDSYTIYRFPKMSLSDHDLINSILEIKQESSNENIQKVFNFLKRTDLASGKIASKYAIYLKKIIRFVRLIFYPRSFFDVLVYKFSRIYRKYVYGSKLRKHHLSSLFVFFDNLFSQREFGLRLNRYQLLNNLSVVVASHIKPNLVIGNDFNGLLAAEAIYDKLGIKFIYDSHELWVERNRPKDFFGSKEKDWEKYSEKLAIKKSMLNLTVCDSISKYLKEAYTLQDNVLVVRNIPEFHEGNISSMVNLKSKFNLPKDTFLLIYIGKITFNRGLEDILRALPLLPKHIKFVTLGHFDLQYKKEFDELVRSNSLNERVFCHDSVDSKLIRSYASTADVSIASTRQICLSYYFALPNKVFESLQAGLPLIVPNSPELMKIVNDYGCGLIYEDKNFSDLADKISKLEKDRKLLSILSEGVAKANLEINWNSERKILINAFRSALANVN